MKWENGCGVDRPFQAHGGWIMEDASLTYQQGERIEHDLVP